MAESSAPVRAFYAYPSKPLSAKDAATTVANDVAHVHVVTLIPWEGLSVNGRLIPAEVFRAIDDSQVLIADLTGLNPNVLYELGYALGKGKRIWLTADTSRTTREAIAVNVPALATTGIHAYENGHQIASAFELDLLKLLESEPLLEQLRRSSERGSNVIPDPVLFLKSKHDTDASIRVSERLSRSDLGVTVDDPSETNARTLSWYIERLNTSAGILVHFTAADRLGADQVNPRYSLVSGLARALGANCLLLQEKATTAVPLDFRDDVRLYELGREARGLVNEWLLPIENDRRQLVAKIAEDEGRVAQRANLAVLHHGMGDFVAENDVQLLSQYFIETAAYLDALAGNAQTVFVGRKGTGKTANLLKLTAELRGSVNNVVCVVKPAGYDVASLVIAFQRLTGDAAREAAMVALWKYLLLTEVAAELGRDYERRMDARLPVTEKAGSLWEHTDKLGWLETTFADRLEAAVGDGNDVAYALDNIYKNQLGPVLGTLGELLSERTRVCVLIDNVDKAWSRDSDFVVLSHFLLSLLVASGEIQALLRKKLVRRVDLSTVVFIRSDILEHVRRVAREPDKLPTTPMRWDDEELLLRIVDERLRAASQMPAAETWRRFFAPSIDSMPTRDYVVSRVLLRPRDVILFVKAAIGWAVNRGHPVVTEDDFKRAEQEYSAYAIDSVKVENVSAAADFDNVLLQLMYGSAVFGAEALAAKLDSASIPKTRHEDLVELFVASSVLGREVDDDRYEFVEDVPSARALALRARRFGERRRLGSRFKIHVAFHRFLEIQS